MKRVLFIRNQSGALVTDKRFVKFGQKGSPDILAFHKGIAYAIEVKTMEGRLTPEQKEWLKQFKDTMGDNGIAIVVRDVTEIISLFNVV